MAWFASLFSSKASLQGRRKVLSSTQEAFSLPSPVSARNGLFSSPNSPDPESATSPSYTYPPQSNGTQYKYISTGCANSEFFFNLPLNSKPLRRKSSRLQPTSLLPLHNAPLSPPSQYPSLEQTWTRIRSWLSAEYPELGDTLNYGILPQDFANIEMQFGFSLPQVIRESYLMVDGQEPESSAACSEGLFFGLHLLPLEEVLEEWRFWREVDDDPNSGAHPQLREFMQSVPPGWIRKEYSQRGWIPLISDKTGNYVGVDLNPGEGGSVGQVIVFGRDFDTKVVLWKGDGPAGWAGWLASFAEVLESGEGFELGAATESEGSEDDVGYEGYFFDGTGRGSGEGTGGMSSGGIRLVGEYRGWTTLEAWADRSVRKWQQVGLVPDPSVEEKGKVRVVFLFWSSRFVLPCCVCRRRRKSAWASWMLPRPLQAPAQRCRSLSLRTSVIQRLPNAMDKALTTLGKYRKRHLSLLFQSQNLPLLSQWTFQLTTTSYLPLILTQMT
jgi:cell wall assembly regulator SMI1